MGYRMDFYGTTICYSIFANTWYGDSPWSGDNICGANGQSFGLFPFDQNIDLIENGLTIGDAWDGRSRHCEGGNRTDNIWVGDGGGHRDYDGYVKVELRRRPLSGSGGLYVGAGCTVGGAILDGIDTPVDAIFSEIKVGYDDSDDQVCGQYHEFDEILTGCSTAYDTTVNATSSNAADIAALQNTISTLQATVRDMTDTLDGMGSQGGMSPHAQSVPVGVDSHGASRGVWIVSGTELAILALLAVNIVICMAMSIAYMRSRSGARNAYKMVSVGTESEIENQ